MVTIIDRDVIVPLLRREFEALDELCGQLTVEQWEQPTCLPGWSVKDNLSHIVGTELMLDGEQAPDVDVAHLDHVTNDIGSFNELWVESMRPMPGQEVLARFRKVTTARLSSVEQMDTGAFDAEGFTPAGRDSYGRFMRIRLFDCYLHEHDIREAVGLDDRLDAEQLEQVLDEMATGLGYVVGKKAGVPAGHRVRIRVTGPVERDLDVEVAERAHLVDELSGPPTVELTLPAMLFLRLGGGRREAGAHIDTDIELGGDTDLARQLATNLAFTI